MAEAIYGIIGEFESPEALVTAAGRAREAGYSQMDAYAPFPVEGLARALGRKRTWVPAFVLGGGILGGVGGYFLQVYALAIDYPLNIGGRPLHSWPAFIPITFELTVLSASVIGMVAMLALCGFPRPHHPVFNATGFERASIDSFFLCIESTDAKFSPEDARTFLQQLGAKNVQEVRDE
jgi:hypothetical protein